MRKRRVYFGLLILAVAGMVGLIVAGACREREPEYGGKRLSEWVKAYARGRGEGATRPGGPADPIALAGTNAIPYLLKWIRYEMPPWKIKLYGAVNPVIKRLNADWELTDEKKVRAEGAEMAFWTLSPVAKGAIPELSAVLNDPKAYRGSGRTAAVLSFLGDDGLLALLAALTNRQATARCKIYVAHQIRGLGTNAGAAIPAMQQLLTDPNLTVRHVATNALIKIDPQALERGGP